jgi:small subunit ribosomal protein S16
MVKIRLSRVGTKNSPKYRIVAVDERVKRDGKFLEILGEYDPTLKEAHINLKKDRIDHWVSVGGQLSDAVKRLMNKS